MIFFVFHIEILSSHDLKSVVYLFELGEEKKQYYVYLLFLPYKNLLPLALSPFSLCHNEFLTDETTTVIRNAQDFFGQFIRNLRETDLQPRNYNLRPDT